MSSKSSKKTAESPVLQPPRPDLPERVLVGRVLRPHGLRGEVVVEGISEVPGRWERGSRLWLTDDQGAALPGRGPGTVEVAAARPHKTGLLVRFAGRDDRDAAEE